MIIEQFQPIQHLPNSDLKYTINSQLVTLLGYLTYSTELSDAALTK